MTKEELVSKLIAFQCGSAGSAVELAGAILRCTGKTRENERLPEYHPDFVPSGFREPT